MQRTKSRERRTRRIARTSTVEPTHDHHRRRRAGRLARPPGRPPRSGVPVTLYEMRPVRPTAVHKTDRLAELVCSNSFRGDKLDNAVGLLKEEMRRLGSLVMRAAEASRVPAGAALAVDRERFARRRSRARSPRIRSITIVREEVARDPAVDRARSGHRRHRSADLRRAVGRHRALVGAEHLYFYDAISPIVLAETIDRGKVFRAVAVGSQPAVATPRRRRRRIRRRRRPTAPPVRPAASTTGEGDYLNCPLTRDGVRARSTTRSSTPSRRRSTTSTRRQFFEGCLPIEVMAHRGVRHAAVRADEAGRPRSIRGPGASLRGGAAAAGQPGRRSLQPGRLPDADQMGRAGARAAADSRARAGRVRALRHGAPQHLRQRSDRARRDLAGAARGRRCSSPGRCRASKATSSRRPRACSPG